MTPEEFIAEAKRRGLPKEEARIKYEKLKENQGQPEEKQISSFPRRAIYGIGEPLIDAPAQMLYNALPKPVQDAGDWVDTWLYDKTGGYIGTPEGSFNQDLANREKDYLAHAPRFDAARLVGNIGSLFAMTRKAPIPSTFGAKMASNAGLGGIAGALTPVYDGGEDFWSSKAKQIGIGSGVGAALTPVTSGIGRMLMPKAATNEKLNKLVSEGVRPTIGQRLGGWANTMEEKAQSLPIMGDFITQARRKARDEFNLATINSTLKPIGRKVTKVGAEGIDEASKLISQAYDDALNGLKAIKLDSKAISEIKNLRTLVKGLPKTQAKQFEKFYKDNIQHRLSPVNGLEARTFKRIESELSAKAARYAKGTAAEQDLGDAFKEALRVLRLQAQRSDPTYAKALKNANEAYARLVRVQGAGGRAANSEGVFTPAQLMAEVKKGDSSARKNMTARGKALMQDIADAGQTVIGNKYPDSGTAGRVLADVGALSTGFYSPAIPLSLFGGGLLYTKPAQNLLNVLATTRPKQAAAIAEMVNKSTPALVPAGVGLLQP